MNDKYITIVWIVALICLTCVIISFTQCSKQATENNTKVRIEALKSNNTNALWIMKGHF